MHQPRLARAALDARRCGPRALGEALAASRADTLSTFAAFEAALPDLLVPLRAEINPPLWELGHVGWFQEFWLARNPQRSHGARAEPDVTRREPLRPGSDSLYHSSHVPHDSRWSLALPSVSATRDDLARGLEQTLALLKDTPDDDNDLYFFRLALLHEDMHHEAALYMARGLGVSIGDTRWQEVPLEAPAASLHFDSQAWFLGEPLGAGFAFDNEQPPRRVELDAFEIDVQVLRWAEFLPFLEAGGYDDPRFWSAAGARWRAKQKSSAPRYLRRADGYWEAWKGGRWGALDPCLAASHLSFFEAEAWCRWAKRRLPSEAEWESAACQAPAQFRWGDVWEWTASAFEPFPGFEPHPYRDYSVPWFDGRPVLRGASHCTQARMRHPRYRNFFTPERNDVPAGFRSCAL